MPEQNLTGVPSAAQDLAINMPPSPEELRRRKKKIMSAASTDPMERYGSAAMALLGARAPNAPM